MEKYRERFHEGYHDTTAAWQMCRLVSEARSIQKYMLKPRDELDHFRRVMKGLSNLLPQAKQELELQSREKDRLHELQKELNIEQNMNKHVNADLSRLRKLNQCLEKKLEEEKSNRLAIKYAMLGNQQDIHYNPNIQEELVRIQEFKREEQSLRAEKRYLEHEVAELRREKRKIAEALRPEKRNTVHNEDIIHRNFGDDIKTLQNEVYQMKKDKEQLEKLLEAERGKSQNLKDAYTRYITWKPEFEKQREDYQTLKKKLAEAQYENERLQSILVHMEETPKTAGVSTRSVVNLLEQLKDARNQLKNTDKELTDVKSRLSRVMGDKLTDNNPNIADLSDRNRPTKISERYQELYDNQWTDAFEIVDSTYRNEEKTVNTLRTILMDAMEFCQKEANRQWIQILDTFSKGRGLSTSVIKQLKGCRKVSAEVYGRELFTEYWTRLSKPYTPEARQIPDFVKECVQICWLMASQDPPLVFGTETKQKTRFDKDLYKAYTKSGDKVAFIVWPVLLLHEGGPVLSKGVAQGIDEQQNISPLAMGPSSKTMVLRHFSSSTPTRFVKQFTKPNLL